MEKLDLSDCLIDIGCTDDQISNFINLEKQGKHKEQLQILQQIKKKLLNSLHDKQKRIDCLDYLMFNLKKDVE